jgi:hypothetical protein
MKRLEVFGVTSPSNELRSCCSLCSRYNLAIRIVGVSKESMRINARTAWPTRLLFRRGGMALSAESGFRTLRNAAESRVNPGVRIAEQRTGVGRA